MQIAGSGGVPGTEQPGDTGATLELHFGDTVYLKSGAWSNYLSARSHTSVRVAPDPDSWEQWTVLDPAYPASTAAVKFNDKVAFASVAWRGSYLSARGSGDRAALKMMTMVQDWEKFRILDLSDTTSTGTVTFGASVLVQSAQWSNYISSRGKDSNATFMMVHPKEWEQWFVHPVGSSRHTYWMAEMATDLEQVPLTQVVFPGSHDAGTYSIEGDAAFSPDLKPDDPLKKLLLASAKLAPKVGTYVARFARAQNQDITHQLLLGMRYFDLRPGASDGGAGTDLLVVHSMYGGDMLKIVTEVGEFLQTHPKEVVILDFSHFTAMTPAHHATLMAHIKSTFGTKLAPRPASATRDNPRAYTYTMGDMWRNGWQVVCLYHSDEASAEPLLWRYGTPEDSETQWWPQKPTVEETKVFLDDVVTRLRPELLAGRLFVLQTILTGDTALYVKAVAKLELDVDAVQAQIDDIVARLPGLQAAVADCRSKGEQTQSDIDGVQNSINDKWDWINSHPYIWEAPKRGVLWLEIQSLEADKAALKKAKGAFDACLSVASEAFTKASDSMRVLQQQLDVPTSLAELAWAGNPTMIDWLDGWRDRGLNIVIMDVPGTAFVDKIRSLNRRP